MIKIKYNDHKLTIQHKNINGRRSEKQKVEVFLHKDKYADT